MSVSLPQEVIREGVEVRPFYILITPGRHREMSVFLMCNSKKAERQKAVITLKELSHSDNQDLS